MAGKTRKLHIAVLAGGPSNEREVSLNSGKQIAEALDSKKYRVTVVKTPARASWLADGSLKKALAGIDLVFIAMHGQYAEDGRLQSILETLDIPYTGSGVTASAIGMSKAKTYQFATASGIFVPKHAFLEKRRDVGKISYPCVVKPNASGSSIGVTIVDSPKKFHSALLKARKESEKVLIEEYVLGREISCGVLGNDADELQVLPVVEIRAQSRFFDYRAKYESSRTEEICPAPLPQEATRTIQDAARKIHAALGCTGLTRSDFILRPSGKLCFLEINTLPGMTKTSLAPKEAAAAGIPFPRFLDIQIELALKAHAKN